MNQVWQVLVGAAAGLLAVFGIHWVWGRKRTAPDPEVAQDNLDNAIAAGGHEIEQANKEAEEHVTNGMDEHDSLAQHLRDRIHK